jgi:hypothetical protein
MRINSRILWLILALLVLAAFSSRAHGAARDTGIPDTLTIDSVVSYPGGISVVPVRFFNDETLAAIELTIKQSSTAITLDSVSFASTRVSGFSTKGLSRNSDGSYTIYVQSMADVIPVGSGLLCRLYYSYPVSITPTVVMLDSTTFIDAQIEKGTWFSDADVLVGAYHPIFHRGFVNIQSSPPTFDSLWVANVTANRGQHVAVDVNLYNERNTKIVELALSLGNDRLIFDSVSFNGTRGAAASSKTYQTDPTSHSLYVGIDYGDATPLAPGTGVVAQLHFTVANDAPDTTITIDSTTYLSLLSTGLTLTSADANVHLTPIFRPGSVAIQISTDVNDHDWPLPDAYALAQNYPNPFNPTTEIEFSLPTNGRVTLNVYNVLGQQVRQLVEGNLPAGSHRVTFDARSSSGEPLSSGIYFYRLTAGTFAQTRKMLFVK